MNPTLRMFLLIAWLESMIPAFCNRSPIVCLFVCLKTYLSPTLRPWPYYQTKKIMRQHSYHLKPELHTQLHASLRILDRTLSVKPKKALSHARDYINHVSWELVMFTSLFMCIISAGSISNEPCILTSLLI